jgi:hypothetical protein
MLPDALGSSWRRHYPWGVDVAWRWILSGVFAIGVGLTVWPTTFILVPGRRARRHRRDEVGPKHPGRSRSFALTRSLQLSRSNERGSPPQGRSPRRL